jgi:DNA replication protein DnaC
MEASKPDDFICPVCGKLFPPEWDKLDEKWRFQEISDAGICRQCQKLQNIRENIGTHLNNAGVPARFLACAFDNFFMTKENIKCLQACKQYPKNHRPDFPGLYLYGNCGTGKTHLVVAIARELVLLGKQVIFTGVPSLCYDIKKTFQNDSLKTELDAVKAYTSCDYLVLDDLGTEKPTEWVRKTLGYIIYERDNRLKPTIITSNLSLDDIAKHVDPRMASRINGMGPVLRFHGPDWRLRPGVG